MDDQTLAEHQHAALMELALKSTHLKSDIHYTKKVIEIYKKCRLQNDEFNLSLVLEYLFVSRRQVGRAKFVELVHQELPNEKENNMLTLAEQFIEQGRQEAIDKTKTLAEQFIEQGRQEAIDKTKHIANRLAAEGIDPGLIKEITGINTEILETTEEHT